MLDGMYVSISNIPLYTKPGDGFDWATYNDSYIPQAVSPTYLYEQVTTCHGFTAVFDGRRSKATFSLAQHIGLDFDGKTAPVKLSSILAHPFVVAYGGFYYPTLSHTPEQPRYRLVFVLDSPIATAEGYLAAMRTVHDLFPEADPACVDVSRQFYGSPHKGEFLGNVLPLGDLRLFARQMIRRQRESQPVPLKREYRRNAALDEKPGLDEIMDRLAGVDPYWLGYDEWVKLGAAIGHEYGELAYGRFKEWSDRPGKAPLTLAKWRSMAQPHSNGAGMGTIIYTLNKYGKGRAA